MVDQIIANTGAVPNELSADAGYCSDANLAALETHGIDAYVAPGRQRHGKTAPSAAQPVTPENRVGRMVQKLRDGAWRSLSLQLMDERCEENRLLRGVRVSARSLAAEESLARQGLTQDSR